MTVTATYPQSSERWRKLHHTWNLLWALTSRDVKARYRRSLLGPLWAVIQPFFLMVVFTVIRGFVDIPSDGIPYPIFSYSVLVPWTFFATAVNQAGPSILGNAGILKKMAVPREVFPASAVLTAAFDMTMAGLVLAGMMVWYQVPVNASLLWLPVLIGMTALFAWAVGIFLAALGVFRRDFLLAGTFLMQLWLYATPIIYPLSSVPEQWRLLYSLNPMVGILEGFRNVLARGLPPELGLLLLALPGIALALLAGWPLFRLMSQYFADVL